METPVDRRLLKVLALCLATVVAIAVFVVGSGAFAFGAVFGSGPVGAALGVVAVLVGVAAWVAFEVTTGEAFAD